MTRSKIFLATSLTLVVAAMLALSGCGVKGCSSAIPGNGGGTSSGSSSGSTPPVSGCVLPGGNANTQTAFVYFMDDAAGQMALEGANVAGSQTFAPVSSFVSPTALPSTSQGGGQDGGLVIVGKQFLYMPFALNGGLFAFSIDATTGALSTITGSPYALSGSSVAADPNGHVVFVGTTGAIYAFTVNSDGSLTAATGSPFSTTGVTPTQLVTDALGKYLYAISGTTVAQYSYSSTTGVLTSIGAITLSPRMTVLTPDTTGAFMFGIDGVSANLYEFTIGSNGALSGTTSIATQQAPVFVAANPAASLVYTFDQSSFGSAAPSQPLEGFSYNSSGTLTAVTNSPFTGLDAAYGIFDQSGTFIFAVGQVGSTGNSGEFAYVVNNTTGVVSSPFSSAGAVGNYAVTDEP